MNTTLQLIENWHVLRLLILATLLVGLVAIALVAGWVGHMIRSRLPRKSLPRVESPAPWHLGPSRDERRAA
ncbi:MAG: hypothetical protein U1F41_03455 [Burkholderiales bacterium]